MKIPAAEENAETAAAAPLPMKSPSHPPPTLPAIHIKPIAPKRKAPAAMLKPTSVRWSRIWLRTVLLFMPMIKARLMRTQKRGSTRTRRKTARTCPPRASSFPGGGDFGPGGAGGTRVPSGASPTSSGRLRRRRKFAGTMMSRMTIPSAR